MVCNRAPFSQEVQCPLGSKADICSAKQHVRFTPNSGHSPAQLSCLLCANSGHSAAHSITSSARASTASGIVMPSGFAVLRSPARLDRALIALGQKKTCGDTCAMSALPPKADIRRRDWNDREGPTVVDIRQRSWRMPIKVSSLR